MRFQICRPHLAPLDLYAAWQIMPCALQRRGLQVQPAATRAAQAMSRQLTPSVRAACDDCLSVVRIVWPWLDALARWMASAVRSALMKPESQARDSRLAPTHIEHGTVAVRHVPAEQRQSLAGGGPGRLTHPHLERRERTELHLDQQTDGRITQGP